MTVDFQLQTGAEVHDPFDLFRAALTDCHRDASARDRAAGILADISDAAESAARAEAGSCARLLIRLFGLIEYASDDSASGVIELAAVLDFIRQSAEALRAHLNSEASDGTLQEVVQQAYERWGDWLTLLPEASCAGQGGDHPGVVWAWQGPSLPDDPADRAFESDEATACAEEVAQFLDAIQANEMSDDGSEAYETAPPLSPSKSGSCPAEVPVEFSGPPPCSQAHLDADLLESYLEDANRCLASIEAAALEYEQAPENPQSVRTIGRDLHTLKGASATIGLSELAAFLHDLEDKVQVGADGNACRLDLPALLDAVDSMRRQISQLGPGPGATYTSGRAAGDVALTEPLGHEETLRVRASHLDRLMDMLAELVMLRNRRDSRVAELQQLNEQLIQSATGLRVRGESISVRTVVRRSELKSRAAESRESKSLPYEPQAVGLHETATDILQIARSKRSVCDQIAEEDLAVSAIIRDFRQELMQLRRLPVSGLFRRLQRAVREAAQATGRQVRFEMRGEHAGLERSLQERLYEPLLHIVRNAVCHGIEPAKLRQGRGKNPVGTVTLEARGGTNLLVLEVRDDGQGLDYDALRRRAMQRGLLAADQPVSRAELARLIFHPGFSTQDQADGVAGRGMGMDVVAETLNRMRSWVEVDSSPGHGTQVRLSIPLRSVIEHTMVFRAGGQLFAVPMQFVHNAADAQLGAASAFQGPSLQIADLMNGQRCPDELCQRLLLGCNDATAADRADVPAAGQRRFELLVDKILGPEEVVVRPLPPLLRHHPLFSGVTLSGAGELVLLFDSRCLIDLALQPTTPIQGEQT